MGDLDRGSPKGWSHGLLLGEGGVPDRLREPRQPEGLGRQPITQPLDVPPREAKPSGQLRLLLVVPRLLVEGLGCCLGEPATLWTLAGHEGKVRSRPEPSTGRGRERSPAWARKAFG